MKKRIITNALVVVIAIAMMTGCAREAAPEANEAPEASPASAPVAADSETANDEGVAELGGAIDTPEDDLNASPYEDVLAVAPFYFEFRGYEINLFQDMADVLEALGEPLGVFEQPSCAFEGNDRVFAYPGVEIFTFPVGDIDLVHTISLRDDSVRTPEGIYIGADFQRVLDALGDDYSHDTGMFTFTRGLTTLEFRVADGIVLGITYGVILDDG